jgi:hypothetical protein
MPTAATMFTIDVTRKYSARHQEGVLLGRLAD